MLFDSNILKITKYFKFEKSDYVVVRSSLHYTQNRMSKCVTTMEKQYTSVDQVIKNSMRFQLLKMICQNMKMISKILHIRHISYKQK